MPNSLDNLKPIEQVLIKEFSMPIHKQLGQIAIENGYKDSSSIIRYIKKLENVGLIKKIKGGKYKTISQKMKNLITIPFYGFAQCGNGGQMLLEEPEYELSLNPAMVQTSSENLFAVKARGHSMTPYIDEGDTVIAKKLSFNEIQRNKFYVVTNDYEVMIKKVEKFNDGYILVSTNVAYSPTGVDEETFSIAGQVVGVYKNLG